MRPFLILFITGILFIFFDSTNIFFLGIGRSDLFFSMVLALFLPIYFAAYRHIALSPKEEKTSYPSLFQGFLLVWFSFFLIWYLHIDFPIVFLLILWITSVFSLLNIRIFFLIVFMFLSAIPIAFLIEEGNMAGIFSQYVFYGLMFGCISDMVAPRIQSIMKRNQWLRYSPPEWELYLSEIQKIFLWYLKNGIYIFIPSLALVTFQRYFWNIHIDTSIPMILIFLFYFSFLIVPIQWKEKNLLHLTF